MAEWVLDRRARANVVSNPLPKAISTHARKNRVTALDRIRDVANGNRSFIPNVPLPHSVTRQRHGIEALGVVISAFIPRQSGPKQRPGAGWMGFFPRCPSSEGG